MELLSYTSLAASIVTFLLLLLAPRWGLPALVVMFPLLQFATPRAGPGLNAETALFVAALLSVLARGRPALPPLRVMAPYLMFIGVMLLGAAVTASSPALPGGLGVRLWQLALPLKSYLWPTLGLLIFFALAPDAALRRRLLLSFTIALLIGAGSSLIWPSQQVASLVLDPDSVRLTGILYRNPNQTGGFLAIFSLVPLTAFFRRDSSRRLRLVSLVAYTTAVIALILTRSRGAWAAYLAGHIVWIFYMNRQLFLPAFVGALLAGTVIASLGLVPQAVSERVEETLTPGRRLHPSSGLAASLDSSAQKRIAILLITADMWRDSPLWGHGFRSFALLSPEYGRGYGMSPGGRRSWAGGISAHSLYSRITAENGTIGLAVLGWFAWALISVGRGLVARNGSERDLGVLFLGALAAVGVHCLVMEALRSHEISLPFWALAGMATRAFYDATRGIRDLGPSGFGARAGSANPAAL